MIGCVDKIGLGSSAIGRMVKKMVIKTYGCQMNVYDSERMSDILLSMGFEETDRPEEAGLVILNTCHIRERAAEKVYSEVGRLRLHKQARAAHGERMLIAVAGCVAQAEGEEMIRRAPDIDLVFGPQTYHRLPEIMAQTLQTGKPVVETQFPAENKFDFLAPAARERTIARGVTAFVTIQEGCDKFCTFCVVPYTRGVEVSRPVTRIEHDIRHLAEAGVREVTLLGQNVNAYHGNGPDGHEWSLGRLLEHLSAIEGIKRLRYTTSHPRDMSDELIMAHARNHKVMPYIHLPVQSGSDRILRAMNRKHTVRTYLNIVERIRSARPDIALSSDFIVGFPGETEEDFQQTLALVNEVGFAQAYSFKYSPRPGTPAAEHDRQIPESVKSERLSRLQTILSHHKQSFNEACLGREMTVLLEKPGRHKDQLIGRSPYLQSVHLTGHGLSIGDMIRVKIDGVGANSLSAQRSHRPMQPSAGSVLCH